MSHQSDTRKEQTLNNLLESHPDYLDLKMLMREMEVLELQKRLKDEENREIRDLRKWYHLIFNHAPVGYLILNDGGDIQEANLTAAKILGVPKKKLEAKLFYDFIPLMYRDDFFLHLRNLRTKRGSASIELPYIQDNGSNHWMEINTVRFTNNASRLYRVGFIDITERKEKEKDLKNNSNRTLREMTRRIEITREEERKRIARELHDDLGQSLIALQLDLQWLQRRIHDKENDEIRGKIERMTEIISDLIEFSTTLSRVIRPELLENGGLIPAVRWQLDQFQERTNIQYTLNAPVEDFNLDSNIALTAFRIFQEALTNVIRHSEASEIKVEMLKDHKIFRMKIIDTGKGFVLENEYNDEFGILGMRERALQWGGDVSVVSNPGEGTSVVVEIPTAG